jgi:hypothetical protein
VLACDERPLCQQRVVDTLQLLSGQHGRPSATTLCVWRLPAIGNDAECPMHRASWRADAGKQCRCADGVLLCPLLTCVRVSLHCVSVVGGEWQHLVMPRPADCAVDVELVDDEVRLEPPAWGNREGATGRQGCRAWKNMSAGMNCQVKLEPPAWGNRRIGQQGGAASRAFVGKGSSQLNGAGCSHTNCTHSCLCYSAMASASAAHRLTLVPHQAQLPYNCHHLVSV